MANKNRSELKSYFVKNAIPTEGNFADLIDSQLNQSQDGIFKVDNEPLSIVAAAGDQRRVLRLYANYPSPNPDWWIALNPAQDAASPASARAGFGIADKAGTTRFFVDTVTGNIGIGTNAPPDKLTVRNGDVRIEGGHYRRLKVVSDQYWAGIELVTREQGGVTGNPHIDFTHGDFDNPNFGIRAFTPNNNTLSVVAGAGAATLTVAGQVHASGGLMFEGAEPHIDRDGALYRNTDGQVYLTVDDNFFVRDYGSNTWAMHFDTNSGSINLKGRLTASGGIHAAANAGVLNIEGADHAYIQWYPLRVAGGRKGWIGYGAPNTTTLAIQSDAGPLQLGGPEVHIYGDVKLQGKHAFRATDTWLRLNQDRAFTSGVHTPTNFAPMALNVGGVNGWGNPGDSNAWIGGKLTVFGDLQVQGNYHLYSPGRMHIFGEEICYILNKKGVTIGKEWGGDGSLRVQGTKNFQIDHPLDNSRYLVHSVIEGPEAAVFYRGEAALVNGTCVVQLPHYFEALTRREYRSVLVTPKLGDGDPTKVSALAAGEIVDGKFTVRAIDSRNPSQRFYWEAKAVRADVEPIDVEPLKGDRPQPLADQPPAPSVPSPVSPPTS